MPISSSSQELIAELLFVILSIDAPSYKISSDNQLEILQESVENGDLLSEIIENLHSYLVKNIMLEDIIEIKSALDLCRQVGAENTVSACREILYRNLNYDDFDVLASVVTLKERIEDHCAGEFWGKNLDIKCAEDILFKDTLELTDQIEECDSLAWNYLDLPFRSKNFESLLIRNFIFYYANTASSQFYFCQKTIKTIQFGGSFSIGELSLGSWGRISNILYPIKDYSKNYNRYYRKLPIFFFFLKPYFAHISVFTLFYWYFEFPFWSEPELYISLLIGVYFGSKYIKSSEKYKLKIYKEQQEQIDLITPLYKKILKLLSFSVDGKDFLIDDLLGKEFSVLQWGFADNHVLMIPDSLKLMLEKAKIDGDILIGA